MWDEPNDDGMHDCMVSWLWQQKCIGDVGTRSIRDGSGAEVAVEIHDNV